MTASDLEIRWNLSPLAEVAPRDRSSFQVTAPSHAAGPELFARLVVRAHPNEPVVSVPENAFVSLSQVAARVLPFGAQHVAGGFVVGPGNLEGLRVLFNELECENLWMTFGGAESIEELRKAIRPRSWWRFAASPPGRGPAGKLECLLSYSASHDSLEVFGKRAVVLNLFDCLRAELRSEGASS